MNGEREGRTSAKKGKKRTRVRGKVGQTTEDTDREKRARTTKRKLQRDRDR